ncbi:MAG: BrnA antitoxin family protein [Rhodocyclaceae bacterium]|nr:BrnA antitoxin family protein [Rhodocyclaceae bacterium]MBR4737783.1 BrnA antitoxin family protein [Rhodocyclaceae bacterium]
MKMTYEIGKLPPLTDEQRKEIAALDAMPDSKIDYTDMPRLTDEDFARMVSNPYYKPKKVQITARVDSDVVAWLKKGGKGYQTRLNNILKKLMLDEIRRNVHA